MGKKSGSPWTVLRSADGLEGVAKVPRLMGEILDYLTECHQAA
jgi:hypothetical protein